MRGRGGGPTGDPEAFGIGAPYDWKRPSNAWTASCIAACTIAISSIADGPGRTGTAVCVAIRFQSVTTSARAIDDAMRSVAKPITNAAKQNMFRLITFH